MRFFFRLPEFGARAMIFCYRYSLSALAGRHCRHLPTCSEYADEAFARYGFWRGGFLTLARLCRCCPLGTHGFDPVPERLPETMRWYTPWHHGLWCRVYTADPHRPNISSRPPDAEAKEEGFQC